MTPRVALVGASGYGRRHLVELLSLHRDGLVEMAAVIDVHRQEDLDAVTAAAGATPAFGSDLASMLAHEHIDTVVIASPPHTHAALAGVALAAGTSVYLEKPPVPTVAELRRLSAVAEGRRFEIGFQQTPGAVGVVVAAREALGTIRRVTGFGALQRADAYYDRARWAGRRALDGVPVGDGSLFNPLAHVLHAALAVARAVSAWAPSQLEVELGSVRDIEADDISAVRLTPAAGPVVTAVGTTAADRVIEPGIVVVGDRATLRLRLRDLSGTLDGSPIVPGVHTSPLRAAVLEPHGAGDPLLSADAAEPFVRVVEASAVIRSTTSLAHLAHHHQRDGDRWALLPGASDAIEAAVDAGSLLSAHGVPIATHRFDLGADGVAFYDESQVWTEGVRT